MTNGNIETPSFGSGGNDYSGSSVSESLNASDSISASNHGPTGQRFVGRENEMRNISSTLSDALSGHGGVVMIAGEPGIGKTRTAQELAHAAQGFGAQVWWGWCYDGHGSPPYWPWLRPLREYIRLTEPDQLSREMGPGTVDIAEIIPEVQQVIAGLNDSVLNYQGSPESARFRLFDAITTFLKNVSDKQPLVIVLDDLQWADSSSLRLLEFVAKEITSSKILIVGTYRDIEVTLGDPLSQALGDLIRDRSFHKIELTGLTQSEAGEFVENISGVCLSDDILRAVHSRTEGNPLFLGEIVGQLRPEEIESGVALSSPIPEGVRDVIGRRLHPLSDECRQVLSIASVIGRDFSLELLDEIMEDVSIDSLLDVLEEALAARLIEELSGRRPRFVFTHPLIQEALLDAVPRARSMRLHMRIAETLERLGEAESETFAAEVAHHCAEAEPVMGSEKLIRYSRLAGQNALKSYAFDEAEKYFHRALDSKRNDPMDAEAAELLSGLGRAQLLLAERHIVSEAIQNLQRSFDYYAGVGDSHKAVDVVQLPISPLPGLRTGAASLISRAMDLSGLEPVEFGHLLNVYGTVMGVEEGDYERSSEALDRALSIAEENGDKLLKRQSLTSAAYVDYLHTRWQESLGKSLEAIALAGNSNDPYAEVIARYVAPLDLITLGSLQEAKYHASSILASAEKARDSFSLASACWINDIVARLNGDWETARSFIQRGLRVSPKDPRLLFSGGMLEFGVGDFTEGYEHLNMLLDLLNETTPGPTPACSNPILVAAVAAYLTGNEDGRLGVAERAARSVLSSPYATGTVAQIARTGLALLSVVRKDSQAASEHYEALIQSKGTFIAYCLSADRMLGLLAQTMGRLDDAAEHFQDALDFCERSLLKPEKGWVCFEYSQCLAERARPADREQMSFLRTEARRISEELSMIPLVQKLEALNSRVGSSVRGSMAYPDGLTQREVEVLGLIAKGRTNREIAETLIISEHTAVRHVSNILAKTSSSNRAEAALYASQHNLTG